MCLYGYPKQNPIGMPFASRVRVLYHATFPNKNQKPKMISSRLDWVNRDAYSLVSGL
jgi:hypothetical protein